MKFEIFWFNLFEFFFQDFLEEKFGKQKKMPLGEQKEVIITKILMKIFSTNFVIV